ncbi:MAG: NUDIX domain-containing protein [Nitrospira sp.]|nr:NUDIX domain-containing protein [Nitrospira sp.]MCA9475536.1 NUDIX domain-containing protein [Nitrospira sp.]MCB9710577.1 NUDIX domain-containing protein [Nitrospiraceae bacterium]
MTRSTQRISAKRSEASLAVGDAVAAIIRIGEDGYLLQHRDNLPHIWYPGHWGCFGGAVHDGEDPLDALVRELHEEIEFQPTKITYFSRFDFDLDPIGLRSYYRTYYLITMSPEERAALVLHEGDAIDVFDGKTIFEELLVTPYDAFALFLFHHRNRLSEDAGGEGIKETTP